MRHGANPYAETLMGGQMPCLHLAVARGCHASVAMLLDHGVGAGSVRPPTELLDRPRP